VTALTAVAEPLLEVRSVNLDFGGLRALDGVCISVQQGHTVGIIGPNGAGKTTLLNCIMGVYPYQSGDVLLRGASLRGLRAHRVVRQGVGRTFQGADYFADLTATQFVLLSRLHKERHGLLANTLGLPAVRRNERSEHAAARSMLARHGLSDIAGARLGGLSYGTRKLLDIVRVIMSEPTLLLLDEPTSGTTAEDREALTAILSEVHAAGLTSLVVDHDVRFVTAVCQDLVIMSSGCVLAAGDPTEILSRPDVIRAYIGSDDGDGNSVDEI
jgi:ABC-type branched-subunit amino acid transport system ATPase component